MNRRIRATVFALLLAVGLEPAAVFGGQFDGDIVLRRDAGLPTGRQTVVGAFWNHTPAYYRLVIELNTAKLATAAITREQFAAIDATAVAHLQLEQYDEALRMIALKEPVDPNDYGLHANRSIIHARWAMSLPAAAFSEHMALAVLEARAAAQIKGNDPFHRDGMYLRILTWLIRVQADPGLRERECLLGYDLSARLATGRERDRAAKVMRTEPLTVADLTALLAEEPGFIEALTAVVVIDSLAVSDGLMALGQLSEAMGEVETAFFAYSRLQEMGGPYERPGLEARTKAMLMKAGATVEIGVGRRVAIPLERAGYDALSEQCFNRYLQARREAQAFAMAYDRFELQQLEKKPFPGAPRILEGFTRQQGPVEPIAGELGRKELDDPPAPVPDRLDPIQFLISVAIWVPVALAVAGFIFWGMRLVRHQGLVTR